MPHTDNTTGVGSGDQLNGDNRDANNTQKFGNDSLYESPVDTYLFNPLSAELVEPAFKAGLTPNGVTTISTVLELIAVYFFATDWMQFAAIAYFLGYLMDCVDGKLARKYNMQSKFGMVYDFNSDMLVHSLLYLVALYKYGLYFSMVMVPIGLGVVANTYYGLVKAIECVNKHNHDKFMIVVLDDVKEVEPKWFAQIFVQFHVSAYNCYASLMHGYEEPQMRDKLMEYFKYFGPGSYAMVITLMLFFNMVTVLCIGFSDFVYVTDYLNHLFVALVFAGFSVVAYLHSGHHDRYVALDPVHYGGLLMGVAILFTYEHVVTLAVGVVLTAFHLCYDVDYRLIRGVSNHQRPTVQKKLE
jgi:phosphatidylglycerophosphate synthase